MPRADRISLIGLAVVLLPTVAFGRVFTCDDGSSMDLFWGNGLAVIQNEGGFAQFSISATLPSAEEYEGASLQEGTHMFLRIEADQATLSQIVTATGDAISTKVCKPA